MKKLSTLKKLCIGKSKTSEASLFLQQKPCITRQRIKKDGCR